MNNIFIILAMIFCHIVDDYYLQGIFANMKQKKWWQENAPQKLYKYDYIVALIMHSMSWSFMIMLPIAISMNFDVSIIFAIVFVGNTIIHAVVDNLKANRLKINLVVDQSIHILQIIITYIILYII
jgi:hypothetical protein